MEIKIKKIGKSKGTVGWLKEGIENGDLIIKEGTLKSNGHHGLWITQIIHGTEVMSQFLAAFNEFDLTKYDYADATTYQVSGDDQSRNGLWTDAAWNALMLIAQAWCDECNNTIEHEEPVKINIIRVV